MKSLLVATDLSGRSASALTRAVDLAREHRSRLAIVHVIDEDLPSSLAEDQLQTAEQMIREQAAKLNLGDAPDISIEVALGRPHLKILQMSEQSAAELIILGMHRQDMFKDMLRGTTVERVIRSANVPVLLVKEQASGPYRRVMVGIDFSVYSRRAIEYAVRLAPDGEFNLVHAYEIPFQAFLRSNDSRYQAEEQHKREFRQLIDQEMRSFLATSGLNTDKIHCVMQEGAVLDVIHERAAQANPDLLVVGTHGRTGVAHAIFGSIAEDLLRDPPCDVVAVKAW